MALPTNDDFANCELSTEELDAIAAGNWLGDAVRAVGHGLSSFFTNPYVWKTALGIVLVGGFISGTTYKQQ